MPKPLPKTIGVPEAALDPNCTWYDTADAAALELARKLPYKQKREHAGAIFQRDADGKFCYSNAVEGGRDNFAMKPTTGPGLRFVGMLHSHWGPDGHLFSEHDVEQANALKRTSYIRGEDGTVLRLDPDPAPTKARAKRARGAHVGNVLETRRDQIAAAYDQHMNPTPKLVEDSSL